MKLKKAIPVILCCALGITCFGCVNDDISRKDRGTKDIRDISAKQLVSEMKIGWSLGNTLDARDSKGLGAETSWGNPKTTDNMIKLLKDTGFNVLRVPVTWDGHMDDDYNVDSDWMARVKEVVDYGINNGLFVILNTHHEEWYYPDAKNKDQDIKQIKALWSQIADVFKGYDEHLIFEGLNEPRLRNSSFEWNGGTPEAQEIVNEYETAFYETVRNSGGNNDKRHLMITGYAASSMTSALEAIKLPENDDKIIVSVHAYLPYSFALDTNGTDKFNENTDTVSIDSLFGSLDKLFLQKGVPVIIGEFGSVNKFNEQDRIACAKYYLSTAKRYGVPCIWWDNGVFVGNGENFGLMRRDAPAAWDSPQFVTEMINTVK